MTPARGRRLVLAGALLLASAAPAPAQTPVTTTLATLIQDIFGPNGLVVNSEARLPDGSTHSAHFNSAFQSNFRQFNIALASQLTSVPLPSPASGFTYRFDPATGTFVRSTQSYGPILADRAETIGRGKVSLGYNYQFLSFDSIEGVDLRRIPALFTHDDFQLGGGRTDVVVTRNEIEASVAQFTGLLTYGVTDRIDVAVAVPVIRTRLRILANAEIERIGTGGSLAVHFFRDDNATDGFGSRRQFFGEGTAAGLGDVVIRVKGTAMREGRRGLAFGLDLRVPSGDEEDLLGSGAPGFRPFGVVSFTYGAVSPHINLAYQWNGRSVLAGDVRSGQKADLPDRLLYVIGADVGVSERLSLAVDYLGERIIDSPRLVRRAFTATGAAGRFMFEDIGFEQASFSAATGAMGVKAKVATNLLVNFNLRFRVGRAGLSDRVAPLVGVEYVF
jgi:hypothetical protein